MRSLINRLSDRLTSASFYPLLVRSLVITLPLQFAISWKLWIPIDRSFPLVSFFPEMPIRFTLTGDLLLILLLLFGLLFLWFDPVSRFGRMIVTIASIFLVLEDVTRLQPWLYLYIFILWTLPHPPRRRPFADPSRKSVAKAIRQNITFPTSDDIDRARFRLRLILAGLYVWSGFLKFNVIFAREIFPFLLSPFGVERMPESLYPVAWLAGLFELLIGLLLLIPRTRRLAWYGGIGMHLFLVITLLLIGWNYVIIPWNLLMILLIGMVAGVERNGEANDAPARSSLNDQLRTPATGAIILLIWVMPILFFFDLWDSHLSGSLYSGNNSEAIFFYHESDRPNLPPVPEDVLYYNEGTEEEFLLIDQWCIEELEAPFYPEIRYFREVGHILRERMNRKAEAGVRITVKSPFTSRERVLEYREGGPRGVSPVTSGE